MFHHLACVFLMKNNSRPTALIETAIRIVLLIEKVILINFELVIWPLRLLKVTIVISSTCPGMGNFYQKLWKLFCTSSKSCFHSKDIQTSVLASSPFFLSVSHCFRGCSKINLKVYDVINYLIKNLTHFVWSLEKEKRLWH